MATHPQPGAAPAPRSAIRRTQYVVVFAVLALLTAVELGVARTEGIARPAVVVALVALAVAKAALIALYYMHLRFETGFLRVTVFGPLLAPAVYGILLILEVGTRSAR